MATKPTDLISWIASGVIESPSSGKKTIGWLAGERPPNQSFNWFWQLVTAWVAWLDAFESDPHTWTGIQTFQAKTKHERTDETDNVPLVEFANADGNVQSYIDTLGARGGACVERNYFFAPRMAPSTAAKVIIVNGSNTTFSGQSELATTVSIAGGSGVLGPDVSSSGWPLNVVQLEGGTTLDDRVVLHGHDFGYHYLCGDDTALVVEFALALDTVGAATDHNFYAGLSDGFEAGGADQNDPAVTVFANFRKEDADTNWQCAVSNGTAETSSDSGVAPVADAMQQFRIEYHGVNTPVGVANGFATTRFFIDGAEVAEIADTNVPAGTEGEFAPFFCVDSDGISPAVSVLMEIGYLKTRFFPIAANGHTLS